jgi:hypothetical protein
MTSSDLIFFHAKGAAYIVKDVTAAGGCVLLSLLRNPNFQEPLTTSQKLRRAIATFTRGPIREDCSRAYALVGNYSNMHFENYL